MTPYKVIQILLLTASLLRVDLLDCWAILTLVATENL